VGQLAPTLGANLGFSLCAGLCGARAGRDSDFTLTQGLRPGLNYAAPPELGRRVADSGPALA
jgi:hypothetical protein